MPLVDRKLACDLARALGVEDLKNVVSITLRLRAGGMATLEVERYVHSDCIRSVEQLQLRAEKPAPEQLGSGEGIAP